MNGKARKLVPHIPRERVRKHLRTAWTGAVAVVIAAGVMFTASASIPAAHPSGQGGDLPIRLYGLLQSITVGDTDTAPDGVTLSQVVAVLERAEQEAREQGPDFSPTIAQAAAELGMLYTTYQMQQMAFGENNEGLRVEDAPARGGDERSADAPGSGTEQDGAGQDRTDDGAGQDGPGRDRIEQDGADDPQLEQDEPPVVQVSNGHTSVIDPHTDDPHAGYVTYEEVVIAAVRLANMLDPSSPNALVEVQGLEERGGVSLRESLLDVVSMFGGSTTGYSNGRIPADVLCPLEFAPGHMLRCDAAERLTALSEKFEEEFGYPIPMTDSYRSYELQVAVASTKPHLAAIPGTSNHGWGLAVDLGNPIAGGSSPEYVWLRLHGPDYGWDNPSWAQLDGAKPEPWHFEFFAAGSIPNRAIDPSDVGTWGPVPTDSASPRYRPALDPKPNDGGPGGVHRPGTKPSDGPGTTPPSQKPTDPPDKPTKPTRPPTKPPTGPPTGGPTDPTDPTDPPTDDPTDPPTDEPTDPPTDDPTDPPTDDPTCPPADEPTDPGSGSEEPTAPGTGDPAPTPSPSPCPSDGDDTGEGDEDGDEQGPAPSSSPSSTLLGTLPQKTGVVADDAED